MKRSDLHTVWRLGRRLPGGWQTPELSLDICRADRGKCTHETACQTLGAARCAPGYQVEAG